jgi:hypothetical protein
MSAKQDSHKIPFAKKIPTTFHLLRTRTRLQTRRESRHVFGAQMNGTIQTQRGNPAH